MLWLYLPEAIASHFLSKHRLVLSDTQKFGAEYVCPESLFSLFLHQILWMVAEGYQKYLKSGIQILQLYFGGLYPIDVEELIPICVPCYCIFAFNVHKDNQCVWFLLAGVHTLQAL